MTHSLLLCLNTLIIYLWLISCLVVYPISIGDSKAEREGAVQASLPSFLHCTGTLPRLDGKTARCASKLTLYLFVQHVPSTPSFSLSLHVVPSFPLFCFVVDPVELTLLDIRIRKISPNKYDQRFLSNSTPLSSSLPRFSGSIARFYFIIAKYFL